MEISDQIEKVQISLSHSLCLSVSLYLCISVSLSLCLSDWLTDPNVMEISDLIEISVSPSLCLKSESLNDYLNVSGEQEDV